MIKTNKQTNKNKTKQNKNMCLFVTNLVRFITKSLIYGISVQHSTGPIDTNLKNNDNNLSKTGALSQRNLLGEFAHFYRITRLNKTMEYFI